VILSSALSSKVYAVTGKCTHRFDYEMPKYNLHTQTELVIKLHLQEMSVGVRRVPYSCCVIIAQVNQDALHWSAQVD